ncbi:MAG: HAD family hydrolase [Candidatus Lokiarchaeota archaeon]|nr:HAD family hydrolase [Candidatus Lokiarchaeota archaeon]
MQKKKSIKAIVWDLDGTIIHFKIDYLRARKTAIEILKKYAVPKQLLTVNISILENMKFAREHFEKEGLHQKKINEIIEEVDIEIIKIEYEAAINAIMIDGIDQVLEFAKKKNLKQAIFTFNTKKNAELSLKNVNLLHYFNLIVGRDNVTNLKPHPEHLIYICKQLNIKSDEILIIGDNIRDIEAAINIGAHSIALHTKLAKVETLQIADKIVKENEIPLKLIEEIEKLIN